MSESWHLLTELERAEITHLLDVLDIKSLKLIDFVRDMWPLVEPSTAFVSGWHIEAICEHLEAVTSGKIRNLLINIPPRHAKSLILSVFWPVWEWVKNPSIKWIFASYGQSLSTRDSLKCRRLIQHIKFQRKYGYRFKLTGDQSTKTRFDNDKMGYRIATSVCGIGTGEGGDRLVCDDPHNVLESESQKIRENVITWWTETMGSRGNDPKTFTRTIVMQRVHQYDLSGHIIERGDYEHLCLPAEYEPRVTVSSINFKDPRTKDGELLWPERFGVAEIARLKSDLGAYASAGQLQQRPAPREGGIVKEGWLKYYTLLKDESGKIKNPQFNFTLQSWDTAFEGSEENDFSVCTTWGFNNDGAFLIDRYKDKPDFPTLCRRAKMLFQEFRPNKVIVEKKASGHSLIQTLKKETQIPVVAVPAKGDKISRLSAISGYIESGRVFLPDNALWLRDFVDELCIFPNSRHDDQVDSAAHALIELFLKTTIQKHEYLNFNIMGR